MIVSATLAKRKIAFSHTKTVSQPMNTGQQTGHPAGERFAEMLAALPAPGSDEFLQLLHSANISVLPAQVLVRAYRHLLDEGNEEAAQLTLDRLLDVSQQHGYLKVVRVLARKQVPDGQNWHDADDLYQAAMLEIVKVLRSSRGVLAETAWVRFCQNCFEDAWRSLHGRRGERLRTEFIEPRRDDESEELVFAVEQTDGADAPWHAGTKKSELPKIEIIIRRTITAMSDPLMKKVAEDQFSDSPSPISSGRGDDDRPPLTEQLGVSRFQISRALRNAKARLAAALLADNEHHVDVEWLKEFLN
jgi:DNA-directed RNA polymerase specialized sigma24 family protein